MSILRVNRSTTKYCVLYNGMIRWNYLPDVCQRILFDVQEQGTKFLSSKILGKIDAGRHYMVAFFLT